MQFLTRASSFWVPPSLKQRPAFPRGLVTAQGPGNRSRIPRSTVTAPGFYPGYSVPWLRALGHRGIPLQRTSAFRHRSLQQSSKRLSRYRGALVPGVLAAGDDRAAAVTAGDNPPPSSKCAGLRGRAAASRTPASRTVGGNPRTSSAPA